MQNLSSISNFSGKDEFSLLRIEVEFYFIIFMIEYYYNDKIIFYI